MMETLARTPQVVREIVRGLSEEQLSRKPAPDAFSLLEKVLHLRDIDIDGFEQRIIRVLSEDVPFLPDINGARLAAERDYNAQPLAPALEAFAASRARSVGRLRALTEQDLERAADLEGVGRVTLRELLRRWIEHDAEHIAEMKAL